MDIKNPYIIDADSSSFQNFITVSSEAEKEEDYPFEFSKTKLWQESFWDKVEQANNAISTPIPSTNFTPQNDKAISMSDDYSTISSQATEASIAKAINLSDIYSHTYDQDDYEINKITSAAYGNQSPLQSRLNSLEDDLSLLSQDMSHIKQLTSEIYRMLSKAFI